MGREIAHNDVSLRLGLYVIFRSSVNITQLWHTRTGVIDKSMRLMLSNLLYKVYTFD